MNQGVNGTARAGWTQMGSPLALHAIAVAGFDWVCVDTQHGAYSRDTLVESMRGWRPEWSPIMIRVPKNDLSDIGFALDLGAAGVIVPLVNTADEARAAVAASLYPPLGDRSWGPLAPRWGAPGATTESANEAVRCWVMIETRAAIDNLDEILAVPGLAGVFVGPTDLSISLGLTVDELVSDDGGADIVRTIVAAAAAAGVPVAAYGGGIADRLFELGVRDLVIGSDFDFVTEGAAAAAAGRLSGSGY